jgi:outer membrane protein insertion porin family
MGRGEYIHGAVSLGQYTRGASFSFTEPYFLGRRMSAGIDLNYLKQDETQYSSYKIRSYGATLRLGVPITENFQVGFSYQIASRDITVPSRYRPASGTACDPNNVGGGGATFNCASIGLLEAQGQQITSAIGYSLTYNTLDNVNDPRNGMLAVFRQDFAGVGGDSQYVRQSLDFHYYHELPRDFVGMLRLQGGNIFGWGGKRLSILDNFFKGQELVRGFAPLGIGPRDISTRRLDPLGGTTYFGGTAEVQFPLFGIPRDFGLRGAIFADAGTLFDYQGIRSFTVPGYGTINATVRDSHKLRSSVGVSLLWNSPIGPLRFNYAYVLTKDRYDRTQAFSFSGGTSF